MVIIPRYRIEDKHEIYKGCPVYILISLVLSFCPVCSTPLNYRDSRYRVMKDYGGKKAWLIINRLECPSCKHLHNELPDFLSPYKHYKNSVIEDVVDEVVTPQSPEVEDYPCERTMHRWHHWMLGNKVQIDGLIKSIGSQCSKEFKNLIFSTDSPMEELRKNGSGWLGTINRIIYNSHQKIPPVPPEAFAPTLF